MTQTIDSEILGYKANQEPEIQADKTIYYDFTLVFPQLRLEKEITDQELMALPSKMGIFSFLDNPAEDIYTLKDGKAL